MAVGLPVGLQAEAGGDIRYRQELQFLREASYPFRMESMARAICSSWLALLLRINEAFLNRP